MGSEELLSPWDGYFRNVRVRAMLALNLTRRGWNHWIGQRRRPNVAAAWNRAMLSHGTHYLWISLTARIRMLMAAKLRVETVMVT